MTGRSPASNGSAPPWWKGERGEWFVVGQFVLMALVFLGPRSLEPRADEPVFREGWPWWLGALLVVAGASLSLAAVRRLGPALTPSPFPVEHAPLVQSGPFALVRHPTYSGLLLVSAGISIVTVGWLTWLYTAALFLLLDVKSRREETWLAEKFCDYPAYRRRVRKLLPFLY